MPIKKYTAIRAVNIALIYHCLWAWPLPSKYRKQDELKGRQEELVRRKRTRFPLGEGTSRTTGKGLSASWSLKEQKSLTSTDAMQFPPIWSLLLGTFYYSSAREMAYSPCGKPAPKEGVLHVEGVFDLRWRTPTCIFSTWTNPILSCF